LENLKDFMAFLVFALGLALLIAGLLTGYMSLDLLPTGPGLLYAFCGSVATVMAIVVFVLGVMIRRVDALTRIVRETSNGNGGYAAPEHASAEHVEPPLLETDLAADEEEPPGATAAAEEEAPAVELESADMKAPATEGAPGAGEPGDAEHPINENRAGHLPTLEEIERAIETPELPAALIGRYSSGGSDYKIFADGSIEAETGEGTFKFATMGDFKQYLVDRKGEKP
jgi:hypothetical protein